VIHLLLVILLHVTTFGDILYRCGGRSEPASTGSSLLAATALLGTMSNWRIRPTESVSPWHPPCSCKVAEPEGTSAFLLLSRGAARCTLQVHHGSTGLTRARAFVTDMQQACQHSLVHIADIVCVSKMKHHVCFSVACCLCMSFWLGLGYAFLSPSCFFSSLAIPE
jgi:hypothetical protein